MNGFSDDKYSQIEDLHALLTSQMEEVAEDMQGLEAILRLTCEAFMVLNNVEEKIETLRTNVKEYGGLLRSVLESDSADVTEDDLSWRNQISEILQEAMSCKDDPDVEIEICWNFNIPEIPPQEP